MSSLRDNLWLQELLDDTWDRYFADVPQHNDVRIVFGRRAKRRLGSISINPADKQTSIITINGIFRSLDVPDFIVRATLVHELCHYAHGFNSPLEQRFNHPHAGGVMRREFADRGLLDLYLQQKRWLKEHWPATLVKEFGPATPKRRVVRSIRVPRPFWFLGD